MVEWHLPEVMMNYLESDERVASSELRAVSSRGLTAGSRKIYIKDYNNGVPLIINNHWIPAFAGMTKVWTPLYIILSSEVSWYSLLEWHLPEVMMNYFESDERVASSEVRPACSHES